MSIYTHTQVVLPSDAKFKISPSQIASFFEYPVVWYKQEVLGEKQFKGNTATVLGTSIHYVAEKYAEARLANKPLDTDFLQTKIEKDLDELDNPDVNKEEVLHFYQMMSEELINQYLSSNIPTQVEYQTIAKVKDGIYVGGSVDNRTNGTIVDYKSATTKPRTDKIAWNHFIQLMAYAWSDKQKGIMTDRIRIVYVVRPTKTLPVRVFTVEQQITLNDWKAIEDVLEMITLTILKAEEDPSLVPLLFKSMNLE
jgi:hypothetical protein